MPMMAVMKVLHMIVIPTLQHNSIQRHLAQPILNLCSPPAIDKPNQPVPLYAAIARVKEAFPICRPLKALQDWEADCARYFKELMRHPWISAA
jgi:hypothetical protein